MSNPQTRPALKGRHLKKTLDDVAAFDTAEATLAAGEDELVRSEIVNSLLANVNAVKVWHEYRSMSQATLADTAGLSQAYIAQIETGKRERRIERHTHPTLK